MKKYKQFIICYWYSHNLGLPYVQNEVKQISELTEVMEDVLSKGLHFMVRPHNGEGYEDCLVVFIDNGNFRQR